MHTEYGITEISRLLFEGAGPRRPIPARSNAVRRVGESVPQGELRIAATLSSVPAQAHRTLAAEHAAAGCSRDRERERKRTARLRPFPHHTGRSGSTAARRPPRRGSQQARAGRSGLRAGVARRLLSRHGARAARPASTDPRVAAAGPARARSSSGQARGRWGPPCGGDGRQRRALPGL
jgi:hypothetical protein